MRYMWMRYDWSKCKSSNIWVVFWMNQVHMLPSVLLIKMESKKNVAGAIRSLINVGSVA